ncbi:MAG: rhodanese-like domain-containing protein [Paracoccaceae bacterium]|nr:rhodanese-like domain-containing protein [Paracoccaceae bacterium]
MKSFIDLLNEANSEIKTITVDELKLILDHPQTLIIDVQSKDVVDNSGMIPNAIHANRGFLEFYADQREDNPFKKKEITTNKKIIVYCGAGGQGALATKTLQDMGFKDVSNLEGGSAAWVKAGNNLI